MTRDIDWEGAEVANVNAFLRKCRNVILSFRDRDGFSPCKVAVVGSFLLRTTSPSNRNVDVVVYMPKERCTEAALRKHDYLSIRESFLSDLAANATFPDNVVGHVVRSHGEKTCVRIAIPQTSFIMRVHAAPDLSPEMKRYYLSEDAAKQRDGAFGALVLEDALMEAHLKQLHGMCTTYPQIVPALVILKEWVRSVGVPFPGVCMSYLMHYLTFTGTIVSSTTWDQVVRLFFTVIANGKVMPHIVRTDDSEGHNVMFRLSPADRQRIQEAAKWWLPKISDTEQSLLHVLCLDTHKTNFWHSWDFFVRVKNVSSPSAQLPLMMHIRNLEQTLARALDGRVALVVGDVETDPAGGLTPNVLFCFRVMDERQCASRLTKGPTVETEADATAFREFWGPKVETRQFSDGGVRVVMLWPVASADATIVRICSHVLHRHHSIAPASIHGVGTNLMSVLPDPENSTRELVMKAYGNLTDYLFKMHETDFPVPIQSVNAAHAALRYASVVPPAPHSNLLHDKERVVVPSAVVSHLAGVEEMPVVVTLARHKMWPDNTTAIENLLASLHVELARQLRKRFGAVCYSSRDATHVVVLGYVFKLVLFYPKSVMLHRAIGNGARADVLERWNVVAPSHHNSFKLHVDQFMSCSAATRLIKRFVGLHLMSEYIAEEALELLALHVFLSSDRPPRTPTAAFLRILDLVATHTWDAQPLILPGSESKAAPNGKVAMHFITPYSDDSPFTRVTPDSTMLLRFVALCRRAVTVAESILSSSTSSWDGVFTPAMTDFDLVLQLSPEMLAAKADTFNVYEKGATDRGPNVHAMVSYDPAKEVTRLLRMQMRDEAMFFRDTSAALENRSTLAVSLLEPVRDLKQLVSSAEKVKSICGDALHNLRVVTPADAPRPSTTGHALESAADELEASAKKRKTVKRAPSPTPEKLPKKETPSTPTPKKAKKAISTSPTPNTNTDNKSPKGKGIAPAAEVDCCIDKEMTTPTKRTTTPSKKDSTTPKSAKRVKKG
eukprot:PhM_4_TR5191/c0_g1_i1/m.46737/K14544/UTP22, NOL6; U3 small nucleolar RNA-associated protein 22